MSLEIVIDGVIGNGENEISAQFVKSQLPTTGEPIKVKIHSEGGSVFEGFAIYDAIASYPGQKTAVIESSAFSIASFIPMACDQIEITPNGYMMLHNPYVGVEGDDEELAKQSHLLGQLKTNMINAYVQRTGRPEEEIRSILKEETYFNATDAVAMGLVNRITPTPVIGRVFAKVQSMPHGIVQALFGAVPGGDNREPTMENSMSESQKPVAATVRQIKAAFPKAKNDFIVKAMEQEMPMEQVAASFANEAMTENETLMARISALETEMAAMKAAAPTAPVPTMQPEVETEMEYAKAKATGVNPVAKATGGSAPSAKAKWDSLIQAKVSAGVPKSKAAMSVNRENPGLREQMLAEVNS